ncbi:MAG: ATP synthase F0 subunit B [Myxococcota bacterium]
MSKTVFALVLLTVLLPSAAFAADTLELIPDYALFGLFGTGPGLGVMWKMLIAFALLVFPLNALIFQPIFGALNERAERIQGARVRSEQLQAEADNVLERYETAIRDARSESESARQAQLLGAREEQAALTAQARGEAERELESARGELSRSLEDARGTLRASAEGLAQAAAEQVLGRAL